MGSWLGGRALYWLNQDEKALFKAKKLVHEPIMINLLKFDSILLFYYYYITILFSWNKVI